VHRKLMVTVLAGLSAFAVLPVATAAARQERQVPGSYIVVFKSSVGSAEQETDKRERNVGFRADLRYSAALKGFAAKLSGPQVEKLQGDPDVDYVAPDRVVEASGAITQGDRAPLGVRRIDAATSNGGQVRGPSTANVAVIDTGADLSHADLNVESGTNCVNPNTAAQDDNGHGTHVAGTIAAKNNSTGVTGVAPGTKVIAVKVLNAQGSGTSAQVICGIDWVTANASAKNIKVANMSLGGSGAPVAPCATTTDPEHKAICNSTAAGVTYVVAAGNSSWDFDYAPQPDTPAAYPEALTVTAMADSDGQGGALGSPPGCSTSNSDDRYAGFSNYAATSAGAAHTIAAPGVCIDSTWMGGGYNTISGTSMATPHEVGAVALCLGENGVPGLCDGLSPAQIVAKMRTEAESATTPVNNYGFVGDPVRPVSGHYYGYLTWAGAGTSPSAPVMPAPDYALSASPASATVRPGRATSYTVKVTPAGGFSSAVKLGVSGLPPGATASFSPTSTASSSTLKVSTLRSSPTGTSTLRIDGSGGGLNRSTEVSLAVTAR